MEAVVVAALKILPANGNTKHSGWNIYSPQSESGKVETSLFSQKASLRCAS